MYHLLGGVASFAASAREASGAKSLTFNLVVPAFRRKTTALTSI
jgi:hypothetical protein